MMTHQHFLSIVIPAYNEETNIRLGALDKVARYLDGRKFQYEVLIVNDGSTDKTSSLIKDFIEDNSHFRLINNDHMGKAATVISGILASKGEIILFTDLDQATPIHQMEKLLPWFDKGYGVVIGSRNSHREGAPFLRRLMAIGFILLRGWLLGLRGIVDTQCGFKAFTKEAIQKILNKIKLYEKHQITQGSMVTAGFDIELLFIARRLGYRIKEVPVEWHYVETRRVNAIKDSYQGLLDMIKIRIHAIRGRYS